MELDQKVMDLPELGALPLLSPRSSPTPLSRWLKLEVRSVVGEICTMHLEVGNMQRHTRNENQFDENIEISLKKKVNEII